MNEDAPVRAIMIGAATLITMITISAVLTYYNVAKQTVREIGPGTDIARLYGLDIEAMLLKPVLSTADVKNIMNYFYGRENVKIEFRKVNIFDNNNADSSIIKTIEYKDKIVMDGTNIMYQNNFNQIIKDIVPSQTYKLTTSELNNKLIINMEVQ